MIKTKWTKEILEDATKSSISVSEVLRRIGLKQGGGNHYYIAKLIKYHNIDTTHFQGQQANNRTIKNFPGKLSWQHVLVYGRSNHKEDTGRLRRAMLEYGFDYVCDICGQLPFHNDKPLVLPIDHKDGDWQNNVPTNLRFLCPNCHTQTENFGSKNIGNKTFSYPNQAEDACSDHAK